MSSKDDDDFELYESLYNVRLSDYLKVYGLKVKDLIELSGRSRRTICTWWYTTHDFEIIKSLVIACVAMNYHKETSALVD